MDRYTFEDDLTGEDVLFDPEQDILVKLKGTRDLPTIYIDGTPVDNPQIRRVIDILTGLRF